MLNTKKPSKVRTFTKKDKLVVKSNHDEAEQESFSEQQRFVRMEIAFTLRKNGGYKTSVLGGRLFPVVRQADRQADENFIV